MSQPVIVAYGRSAACRARKGGWATTNIIDVGAGTLKGVLAKVPQIAPEDIDDVITGAARHINELDLNASRLIVQRAGLPECVCAQTINRFCSSGLQAIATASNAILADQYKVCVAGGVEGMTRCFVPLGLEYQNEWLNENIPGAYMTMGETAERVAERYNISRADQEQMALESHTKAAIARKNGWLQQSIIPFANAEGVVQEYDDGILADMDGNLKTSLEKMATMKPCFLVPGYREEGVVTAATSSQTTDAAAYAVLTSEEYAAEKGIKPLAKLVTFAVAGCDPEVMGTGPIYAIPKALKQANMTIDQMDVIELNEAFASQAIACIRELNLPKEKVNPWGGAMALGHPMGATGAFLMSKALDYCRINNGKYAMVTMCIGGGMGACGIFELL